MRWFRVFLVAVGVISFVVAILRLDVRQIDRTGLCGSIVQGSSFDDGGSTTHDCNRLRHDDGVTAVAFVIVGVVALGFGIGHTLCGRRSASHAG